MKASPEDLKQSRKLEILLNQSRVGVAGGCLFTALAVMLVWDLASHMLLLAWLLFYCACSYFRYRLCQTVLPQIPQHAVLKKVRLQYTAATFLCGLSWGLMSLYILQGDVFAYSLFTIILVESMTAVAATLYSIYPSVYYAFALPALLPQAAYFLMHENTAENSYGVLIIIFLTLMSISAQQMRKLVMKSIGIQFENLRLLDDIEREKTQVSDLNNQLQHDLQELRQRDMQLSEEKDKAESLAEKLLILSTRDGLTGIANRRHFDEFLAKEWNRSVRSRTQIALIMADIDHFKAYNDHYGHQKGDRCLQQVSAILEEHTRREGDLAARYGGEEFAIILSDTSLENAVINAEKIRCAIEKAAIAHEASAVANIITVSMGVSCIRPNRNVFSATLIAEADRLLYQAKAAGRNRIVANACHVEPDDRDRSAVAMEAETQV